MNSQDNVLAYMIIMICCIFTYNAAWIANADKFEEVDTGSVVLGGADVIEPIKATNSHDILVSRAPIKKISISPEPKVVAKLEHKSETKPKEKAPEPPVDEDNAYLLAQIISAEAKGEPYNGKIAVGNVIMNRVDSGEFPNTIREVIFQKGQFSPVTNGTIYNKPDNDSISAAKEVLSGKRVVGGSALYFYNPSIAKSGWIFARTTLATIGNHRFAH